MRRTWMQISIFVPKADDTINKLSEAKTWLYSLILPWPHLDLPLLRPPSKAQTSPIYDLPMKKDFITLRHKCFFGVLTVARLFIHLSHLWCWALMYLYEWVKMSFSDMESWQHLIVPLELHSHRYLTVVSLQCKCLC